MKVEDLHRKFVLHEGHKVQIKNNRNGILRLTCVKCNVILFGVQEKSNKLIYGTDCR